MRRRQLRRLAADADRVPPPGVDVAAARDAARQRAAALARGERPGPLDGWHAAVLRAHARARRVDLDADADAARRRWLADRLAGAAR